MKGLQLSPRPVRGRLLFRCVPVILLILAAALFFYRSPALILSDAGFDTLYGARRSFLKQAGLSLRFFRRVKRVLIAEDANPEAAVFAIEEGSRRPWAVLGHSRYLRGLELYARRRPEVRVTVIREDSPPLSDGSPRQEAQPGEVESVFADTRLNSWRAGLCAAILAGESPGQVLVFQDRQHYPVNREAFTAGLQEENKSLSAVFLNGDIDYHAWDQVLCVVLGGPANSYFDRKDTIPALLFTWTDGALSPSTVKVLGDDSPWALAREAFRPPSGGEAYRIVPAEFTVLRGRTGAELGKRLKKAVHSQIPAR
ncbi:MAG: hypothetical protein LBQ46_06490 [Treponema sp.]|jgi:hypothetical protein|nr:hypothetical protein [Treponema sp.]